MVLRCILDLQIYLFKLALVYLGPIIIQITVYNFNPGFMFVLYPLILNTPHSFRYTFKHK